MRTLAFIIFILNSTFCFSQNRAKNTLYFQALGTSFFYSINYDRILTNKISPNISGRAGMMYWEDRVRSMASIPLSISYLKGINKSNSNNLEIGLSTSIFYEDYLDHDSKILTLTPGPHLGFRHQPVDGGIFYSFILQYSVINSFELLKKESYQNETVPWIGIAIGYTFY